MMLSVLFFFTLLSVHRGKRDCSLAYPFYSIRRFRAQGHTMVDMLLTVKYRLEIVLGTLGLNTRGCVPARRHREALLKTSQNDISQRYRRPTSSNMPSNPRNHQYLFVPDGENRAARFPLTSQFLSANPLGSTEMFYIAKSMPTSGPPSVRSPSYCT